MCFHLEADSEELEALTEAQNSVKLHHTIDDNIKIVHYLFAQKLQHVFLNCYDEIFNLSALWLGQCF